MSVINHEEIQELLSVMEVPFDDNLIDKLCNGFQSHKLTNVRIAENEYKDGNLRVFRDKNKLLQIDFQPVFQELSIPAEILGHKLTPEEKKKLEEENHIDIKKGSEIFKIVIDPKINQVIIQNDKQKIEILEEIGGYKLTQMEQKALSEGATIGPKILYDPKTNSYIQTSISLTSDKTGIKFNNVKTVSKEEAQELTQRFNKENLKNTTQALSNITSQIKSESVQNSLLNSVSNIITENSSLTASEQKSLDNTIGKSSEEIAATISPNEIDNAKSAVSSNSEKELLGCLKTNNLDTEKLTTLLDANPQLKQDKELIGNVFKSENYNSLTANEKIAVNFILEQNPQNFSTSISDKEFETILMSSQNLDKLKQITEKYILSNSQLKTFENHIIKNQSSFSENQLSSLKTELEKANTKIVNQHTKSIGLPKSNSFKI